MNMKKWFLPLAMIALVLGLAACSDKDKDEDEAGDSPSGEGEVDQEAIDEMNKKLAEQEVENDLVVAVVNDEELLGDRYNIVLQNVQVQFQQMGQDPTTDEIKDEIKSITLKEMVNQTLLLQQARADEIEVLEEEIENEYNMMIEQFGDEETLLAALEAENIEVDEFKTQIKDSILYSKYQDKVVPEVEVAEEEIENYYNELAEQTEGDEELPPLEELSDDIRDFMAQEEQQKLLMAHIEELREKAEIDLKI